MDPAGGQLLRRCTDTSRCVAVGAPAPVASRAWVEGSCGTEAGYIHQGMLRKSPGFCDAADPGRRANTTPNAVST
jgi:hypothetical protein